MANTELVQATNSLIAALQKRIKFIDLNEESKFIKVGAVGRGGGPSQAGSALLL